METTAMKNEIEFTATAKAFSGQAQRQHKFILTPDGSVKVWDSIAGHYTSVHAMSEKTTKRLAKLAVSQ